MFRSCALLLVVAAAACTSLAHAQSPATDWPWAGRFAEQNKSVGYQPHRVVFLGDSITEHWIQFDPAFFQQHPFLNRGIYGQTTPQLLLRFQPDVVALKPEAVVILAGVNDLAGNTGPETLEYIQGNLASMVAIGKANHIQVVLSSILPVTNAYKPQTAHHDPGSIRALNAWMQSFCRTAGCVYMDYSRAVSDAQGNLRSDLTSDGIHPTLAGYKLMEPIVLKTLQGLPTAK